MGRLIDVDDLRIALGMGVLCGNKTAIQLINEAPIVEAIPKVDYENRLKADMAAMLEELKSYIELMASLEGDPPFAEGEKFCAELIQQKIDKLKEAKDGENND